MTKLAIAKLVINLATGIGVAKVTNDIISNNVNIDSTEDKIKVALGGLVVGSMVGEMASSHVNAKVDMIASLWQNRKSVKPPVEMTESLTDAA